MILYSDILIIWYTLVFCYCWYKTSKIWQCLFTDNRQTWALILRILEYFSLLCFKVRTCGIHIFVLYLEDRAKIRITNHWNLYFRINFKAKYRYIVCLNYKIKFLYTIKKYEWQQIKELILKAMSLTLTLTKRFR